MAITLAALKQELQNFGYGTDTATAQTAAINAAMRDIYNYRRWPWAISENSTALALGAKETSDIAYGEISAVNIVNTATGESSELEYLEQQDLLDKYYENTNLQGTPTYWTRIGARIRVWPTADTNYQLKVQGTLPPYTMTVDTDTTQTVLMFPDEYRDLIIWGALKHLAFRERDWDAMDAAERQYKSLLFAIASNSGMTQRGESTEVERSGFFDNYDGPIDIM